MPLDDDNPDDPVTQLSVKFIGQGAYNELCWAACCAMVLTADGKPTSLLGAAEEVQGDTVNQPQDPLWALERCKLNVQACDAPLTAQSLQEQVVNGRRPAEIYWEYTDGRGGGHVALVIGYASDSETFCLCDPWLGPGWVSYEYLMSYNNVAAWMKSFYLIGTAL